ncbi:hypothetical protein [Nesterenkonia halotolerans]|uniref:ATP-grasp domain-containing protein n=1 Tax=Nesterenkonia halotolerans TaxID=225325 RepID=A0ABR9J762_9MICC|nr:hypothetical protein [Nesterenkonia halotolerans]MBE1514692.1 hypothetical protein [Nesterenkonia halotolerans]
MPPETIDARLIIDTLANRSMNAFAEVPRHDQLIRLALRRRRVELRPVGERSLVFVFGGVVVGGMDATVTTLVSAHARRITSDPNLLRRHLEIQEIPVEPQVVTMEPAEPQAAALEPGAEPEATGEAPAEQQAAEPEPQTADESSQTPAPPANSVRVFVVGDRVCAALLRVSPVVLGDGTSTLRELLEQDAVARGRHALVASPPEWDPTAQAAGSDVDTRVPASNELVHLGESREISGGGLHIDLTDEFPDSLQELAVEAVAAVPGLNAAAVDLEVIDLETAEGAFVRAVLPEADISPAHYPAYGDSHDVAGAIAEEILLRASR